MKKKKLISLLTFAVFLVCSACIWYGNGNVKLTEAEFISARLPKSFNNFTVALVSDLHGASFGKNQKQLISQIRAADPDIIAVTGDIIDSRRLEEEDALVFAEEAVNIAPVYYVPGNHEARIDSYPEFEKRLSDIGVTVMRNETLTLERNGENIRIIGIDDPLFIMKDKPLTAESAVSKKLEETMNMNNGEGFTLLLAHRPELIEAYSSFGIDLVLSGHAHGGQVRLPFIGGLYAPGQGFFPKYTDGEAQFGGTSVIISRGLGNSIFPFRVNNDPEVVAVHLKCSE